MRARTGFLRSTGGGTVLLCSLWLSTGAHVSCQPNVVLGRNSPPAEEPAFSDGGAGGSEPTVVTSEPWSGSFGEGGSAGAGGDPEDPGLIQGHVCEVTHPGEVHPEPIAVCCELNEAEQLWAEDVLIELNSFRETEGLALLEMDDGLNSAAVAWAMHWSLHWDPVSEEGRPGTGYSPSRVAEACGTSATLNMYTNALDEPRDEAGLISSEFPVEYWKNDENLSTRILNPDYRRIGVGNYAGFLVALMDR